MGLWDGVVKFRSKHPLVNESDLGNSFGTVFCAVYISPTTQSHSWKCQCNRYFYESAISLLMDSYSAFLERPSHGLFQSFQENFVDTDFLLLGYYLDISICLPANDAIWKIINGLALVVK
jgi:hypothetical protein